MAERICFVGHTHDLELVANASGEITRQPLEKGFTRLQPDQAYIVNVGSVGQPRDGDNNAKYVIWDTAAHMLELKFIPYDIAAVAGKIIAAGLPRAHARRLW
jgi:diadenosine tetraphosphatase ApaH/serine/threonine PP2A family protein phosphatase